VLELKGVSKKYGFLKAVDNVSFTVRPGESVGYLGPNGAGKSTTIKMLAGLLEPTGGEIIYQGRNVWKNLVWFKARLGFVPEEPAIYSHLSAYDYLLMVGRLRKIQESVLKNKIKGFIEVFLLGTDMYSEIASFSRGMVQKVLIAAALLHDPEILLLDEPLFGLDVSTALVIRELMGAAREEEKETGRRVEKLQGEIEFKEVYFNYDGQKPVFEGLNLRISAGEKVLITGQNGSGKSTLMKLILGLYHPRRG